MDKNRAFQLLVFILLVLAFLKMGLKLIIWIVIGVIVVSLIYYLLNR